MSQLDKLSLPREAISARNRLHLVQLLEKKNWEPPKEKSQAMAEAIVCSPQADGKTLFMMPILTNLIKLIRTFTGADFMIQEGTLQSARRGKKPRT